jgi:hypothetical protein
MWCGAVDELNWFTPGRPIRRWEQNFKIFPKCMWHEYADRTKVIQTRDVANTLINTLVPQKVENFWTS